MLRASIAAILLLIIPALGGCSSGGKTPDFQVPAGRYAAAFDAARDALVADRFEIDRVDAAAGVITTFPKRTAGMATPWDPEQVTFGQEWEDLINDQQRRVRITFEPATPGSTMDLREVAGPIVGHVEVAIDRIQHSGWRLETTALRFSTISRDPEMVDRGMWPVYAVPFSQDPRVAGSLAKRIERAAARPPSTRQ